jgi:hypothetical protein
VGDRYRRDSHVLGSAIVLNRKTYSIIGVMPRRFDLPPANDQAQVWVPMSLTRKTPSGNSVLLTGSALF